VGITNATALGYQAKVSQSDSLVLGSINGLNGATASVKVGIGTASPDAPLHVKRSDGTARILVRETNATIARRTLFELQNNGGSDFRLRNTNTGTNWFFSMDTNENFLFSLSGTGGPELMIRTNGIVQMGPGGKDNFVLDADGNLEIAGILTQLSDRSSKENLSPVDSQDVLEKVVGLPVSEWNFKTDEDGIRHIGPMAQDFREAFGLGKDERHISSMDTSGVALAAIQALYQGLQEKELRVQKLETELSELETLKAELAKIKRMLATR
jgi:hypothetical protein